MKTLRRVGQAVVRKRTVTDTEIEYLSMQFHRSFRPIERHPSVRVRESPKATRVLARRRSPHGIRAPLPRSNCAEQTRFARGVPIPTLHTNILFSLKLPVPNIAWPRKGYPHPPVLHSPGRSLPALVGVSRSPRPPSWGAGRARSWRHFAIGSSRRWRLRARLPGRRCACVAFRSRYVVLGRRGRSVDDGRRRERWEKGRGAAGGAWPGGRGHVPGVLCFLAGAWRGRRWTWTRFEEMERPCTTRKGGVEDERPACETCGRRNDRHERSPRDAAELTNRTITFHVGRETRLNRRPKKTWSSSSKGSSWNT